MEKNNQENGRVKKENGSQQRDKLTISPKIKQFRSAKRPVNSTFTPSSTYAKKEERDGSLQGDKPRESRYGASSKPRYEHSKPYKKYGERSSTEGSSDKPSESKYGASSKPRYEHSKSYKKYGERSTTEGSSDKPSESKYGASSKPRYEHSKPYKKYGERSSTEGSSDKPSESKYGASSKPRYEHSKPYKKYGERSTSEQNSSDKQSDAKYSTSNKPRYEHSKPYKKYGERSTSEQNSSDKQSDAKYSTTNKPRYEHSKPYKKYGERSTSEQNSSDKQSDAKYSTTNKPRYEHSKPYKKYGERSTSEQNSSDKQSDSKYSTTNKPRYEHSKPYKKYGERSTSEQNSSDKQSDSKYSTTNKPRYEHSKPYKKYGERSVGEGENSEYKKEYSKPNPKYEHKGKRTPYIKNGNSSSSDKSSYKKGVDGRKSSQSKSSDDGQDDHYQNPTRFGKSYDNERKIDSKDKALYRVAKHEEFSVEAESELFPFLKIKLSKLSRNNIKGLLSRSQISINGIVTTQYDTPVKKGDLVVVHATSQSVVKSLAHDLNILYEDDDLIAINKNEGLLSVDDDKGTPNTLFNQVQEYVKAKDPRANVYVLHRLDKNTSGVICFGKNLKLVIALQKDWNNLVTRRGYYAIIEGTLQAKTGVLRNYINEDNIDRVYVVNENGKQAITNYEVIKENEDYTLLDVQLETGRRNQIRVQFSYIGHNVVGDNKYGHASNPLGRLGLHAYQLTFKSPLNDKVYNFKTSIPKEFTKLLSK